LVDHLVLLNNELFKLLLEFLVGFARLLSQVIQHLAQNAVESIFELLGDALGPILCFLLVPLIHLAQAGFCLVSPLLSSLKVNVALKEIFDGVLRALLPLHRSSVFNDCFLKSVLLKHQEARVALPFPVIAANADFCLLPFDFSIVEIPFNQFLSIGFRHCAFPVRIAFEVFCGGNLPCSALG